MCDEFDISDLGVLDETADDSQTDYLYLQTLLDKEPPYSSRDIRRSLRFAVNQWHASEMTVIKIKLVRHNEAPAWGCIYHS